MSAPRRRKVVVAMSGGVDSSVAAAMLKDDGYDVVGCFMRLGNEPAGANTCDSAAAPPPSGGGSGGGGRAHHQGCCSVNDAADARLVAAMLDVPFYVLNFRDDFGRVIDYFVSEYNAGRTPNPCVRCNDWLKFGKLAAYARSIDADFIASGHYARIDRVQSSEFRVQSSELAESPEAASAKPQATSHKPQPPRLLRGIDHKKDQSYVLFGTRREMLNHMLLPIGGMTKPEVRAAAERYGLPVFDKPDSQEICFVPDNDYAALVQRRSPENVRPGDVLDTDGNILAQHPGQQHFTVGQRRGTGVARGYPLYVINRDAAANTVTVGAREALLCDALTADQTNWLIDPPTAGPRPCTVKIRYNCQPVPATVHATGPDTLRVQFDQPQSAVTPGQAVVCYDGDELIGGGWIR